MPRIPRARVAGHATLLTRVYWMYEVRYVRGARVSVLSLASYTQHTGPLSHPTVPLSHVTGHWHWPLESLGGWRRMEEDTWVFSPNPGLIAARGGSPAKVKERMKKGRRWREELFTSISPVFTHSG